ncbi:GNAT family N-acetyltransferase [Actomonas aquatica]|uniref:GNAT family protein n=1 Tax=Actomonas aquatica TaxID=2866162 RepID=A0ABZ1C4Q1_9BACT|nr:GNAT family protein [Opitutus sp. WL0086]WRQ86313.1 GNAT family protein [Opitutus sp. WL0086]
MSAAAHSPSIPPLTTSRLRLEALPLRALRDLAAGRASRVVSTLNFHTPDPALLPSAAFARQRLQLVQDNPVQLGWIHRSIVLAATDTLIGSINFHHLPPDPFLLPYSHHGAELGYRIAPDHRNQGYATEAVRAMMTWAQQTADLQACFLSISPDNTASLRLALKLGFQQIGQQHDEIDGIEWIFRKELASPQRHSAAR